RSVGDAPLVLVVVDPLPGLAAVHGAEDPAFAVALRGGEDRRTIPAGRGRAEADHVGRVEARELFPAVPAVCRTEQPVAAVPVALGVSAGRPYLAGDAGDGGQVHLPAAWEHCGGVGSSGLCEGEAAIRRRVHRSVGPRVDELRVDAVGFHSGEAVDPGGLLPGLTVIGADLHPDTWGGPDGGSAVGGDRDDPRFLGALDRRTGGPRRAGIVRGGDPSDAFAIDAGTNEDVLVESGDVDAAGIPQIGVLDHARHLIDVLVDEAAQVVHR